MLFLRFKDMVQQHKMELVFDLQRDILLLSMAAACQRNGYAEQCRKVSDKVVMDFINSGSVTSEVQREMAECINTFLEKMEAYGILISCPPLEDLNDR